METTTPTEEPEPGAKRVKRTPEEVKALLLAYMDNGDQWPEGMDRELIKYYRRTYLSPKGGKHVLYLAWRQEWSKSQGIVYLPNRRAN